MIKVGDRVRLKSTGEIVTVQEVNHIPKYDFYSFWSDELSNTWYTSSYNTIKKNWHNANEKYIEILEPDIMSPKKKMVPHLMGISPDWIT